MTFWNIFCSLGRFWYHVPTKKNLPTLAWGANPRSFSVFLLHSDQPSAEPQRLLVCNSFLGKICFHKKLPGYTLAGFDLTSHSSNLPGGRRRRYLYLVLPTYTTPPLESKNDNMLSNFGRISVILSQFYDFELHRQGCKNLQRHGKPIVFLKSIIFSSTLKNALAYYSAGVVGSCKFQSRRIGSWFKTSHDSSEDLTLVGGIRTWDRCRGLGVNLFVLVDVEQPQDVLLRLATPEAGGTRL
jgi:hypothetical protein